MVIGVVEGLAGDGVEERVGGLVGVGEVGGPLRVGGLMVVSKPGSGTGQYHVGRVVCTCF